MLTVIASFIPVFCRFIMYLGYSISWFDMKDILFAALALNLSNLNLIGTKNIDDKDIIVVSSCFLIFFIGLILGILYSKENDPNKSINISLLVMSIVFTIGSLLLSYGANNSAIKNVQQ